MPANPNPEQDNKRQPHRATLNFTFAALDDEDAERLFDAADEALEAVTGISTEGGAMSLMDHADVIDGSPLARALSPEVTPATPNPETRDVVARLKQSAYPSLSRAAAILGVDPSTLSRHQPPFEPVGSEKRIPAWAVIDEAAYFNKRDLNEVAFDLVAVAEEQSPEAVTVIEQEITEHFRAIEHAVRDERAESDNLESGPADRPEAER